MSPLDQALIDLMLDEIQITPAIGLDKFNNVQYGEPYTVRCQTVRSSQMARDREGREVLSHYQFILAQPELIISENDLLDIPGEVGNPAIIEVLSAKDEVGPYYLEIRA